MGCDAESSHLSQHALSGLYLPHRRQSAGTLPRVWMKLSMGRGGSELSPCHSPATQMLGISKQFAQVESNSMSTYPLVLALRILSDIDRSLLLDAENLSGMRSECPHDGVASQPAVPKLQPIQVLVQLLRCSFSDLRNILNRAIVVPTQRGETQLKN